jgi:hypothetical protein
MDSAWQPQSKYQFPKRKDTLKILNSITEKKDETHGSLRVVRHFMPRTQFILQALCRLLKQAFRDFS